MKYIVLIFIITSSMLCKAQSSIMYNQPQHDGKFYVVISDSKNHDSLKNDIINYTTDNPKKSFILFNADILPIDEIKNEINQLLNGSNGVPKQYTYLIIAGDTSFLQRNITIKSRIFTSTLYLNTDEVKSQLDGIITEQYPNQKTFPDLIKTLKGFIFGFTLINIKQNSIIDLNSGVQGTSVGLNIGSFFAGNNNYKTYVPNSFVTYGFHIIQPIKPKFQAKFETNFSIKIPNPKDDIQEQIQSQIDFSALMDGDDIKEEVTINAEIKGHIYYNFGLSLEYFPLKAKTISPYLGFGISYSNLRSFSAQIDTTTLLEIDASSFSPGDQGEGFDGFDQESLRNDEGNDLNSTNYKSLEIPLSLGAYFKLSNRVRFSLNSTLHVPLNSSYINNNGSNYLNHLNFNVGLAIKFKSKDLFYQYIK